MNAPRPIGFTIFYRLNAKNALCSPTSDRLQNQGKIYLIGKLLPLTATPVAQVSLNNAPAWFWLLLVFILLVVGGYLLYQVRLKQLLERRVYSYQQERDLLFDHAPCGYHSVDQDGVLINANDTLLHWLGYDKSEVLDKIKFVDMVAGDREQAAETIASIAHSRSGRANIVLIKKNGDVLPVILSSIYITGLTTVPRDRLYCTIDNKRCHEALERIETLNQELEAFSYSISHDLRAPLRSIDGYSRILQEDYGDTLDDEGKRVLNVVTNNAKRMGKLIDDLLDFGRLGRKAILSSKINMTAIVNNIVAELQAQEQSRHIDITVEELHPASGDADMLRQVWYNLLENAVKYTGKKEHSIITVRSYPIGYNEICYAVQDNGVGFDILYSDKLFGIFQRLHKMQDFSGTGVGLAIVKRIITRHGGRVWAEGSLKGGSTFYFTLLSDDENT